MLARLPKIPNVSEEFFGIGYYSDSGFIFMILTEELISKFPLRMIPFPSNSEYLSECHIEIIGKINSLPGIKHERN